MKRIIVILIAICLAIGGWFLYSELYTSVAQDSDSVQFEVQQGESVSALAERLEAEGVIRNAWLFSKYLVWKGLDRDVRVGQFAVERPITLARVAEALSQPGLSEREVTILPGWDLRDIAAYLIEQGFAESEEEVYEITGEPAKQYGPADIFGPSLDLIDEKPGSVSVEGYLAPETIRFYADAPLADVIDTFIFERDKELTQEMRSDSEKAGRTIHEALTMASIVEREVRSPDDKKKVADIFWRRYEMNWALQADSTVHYAVGKSGNVFTTNEDRQSLSPWNTYRYPGLPPSPISNPSVESIMAAIYPEKNEYWYFLTTLEGEVKYAKTLEEHNVNVQRYLR